jgi:hypothetical protein
MTKRAIDKYFTANHSDIKNYIKNQFFKTNIFKESPDYFLTECYLYVTKRKDDINDVIELSKYISTFIFNHTNWKNSRVRELDCYHRASKLVEFNVEKYNQVNEGGIEEKIFNELAITDYKAISELYYQQLSTLEEKVVWEIYFLEGCTSYAKFGAHIGRSRSVGEKYVKWLREDLKSFYIAYKEKYDKYDK